MKISVNDMELFTINDVKKAVIQYVIHKDDFDEDMRRRLHYIINHKYEQCYKKLKEEWDQKLITNGVKSVPTDPDEYAQLVFSQPNYQDRKAREEASGE